MIPHRISSRSDLARVYRALADTRVAQEGEIASRTGIRDTHRIKYLLGILRVLGVADLVAGKSTRWEVQPGGTRSKGEVNTAIRYVVLTCIRERPGRPSSEILERTGLHHQEVQRSSKVLVARGEVTAEKRNGLLHYTATQAEVIPLMGMIEGPGERHDCARNGLCLTEFLKRAPDAAECHCRPGCAPVLVSREDMLARATVRRSSNYAAAGY